MDKVIEVLRKRIVELEKELERVKKDAAYYQSLANSYRDAVFGKDDWGI